MVAISSLFIIRLRHRYYFNFHFTDGKTEALGGKIIYFRLNGGEKWYKPS